MDVASFKCPKCEFTHTKLNSLRIHCQKSHGISSIDLRIALFGRPTCVCGCGELTEFNTLQLGFNRYVLGHIARVNNGWGHNKKALKKSQDKRREQIASGDWNPWNKGETKETHPSVELYGKSCSATLNANSEELMKRSYRMRKNRLDGTIPTLYGKDHSQWKGGVSALQPLCRSYVYNSWARPKMKASDWKCKQCRNSGPLEVHHDKERFAEILQKAITALGEPGDDFEKKAAFAQWVSDYHVDNNVSGIVLCEKCHSSAH